MPKILLDSDAYYPVYLPVSTPRPGLDEVTLSDAEYELWTSATASWEYLNALIDHRLHPADGSEYVAQKRAAMNAAGIPTPATPDERSPKEPHDI